MDLTEILKDKEGTKLYSPLFGQVILEGVTPNPIFGKNFPIKVSAHSFGSTTNVWFTREGYYFEGYDNCECLLFPSKENRDWSKFKSDLPIGTPVMVSDTPAMEWALRYYAGNGSTYDAQALCGTSTSQWKFVVPVCQFNFKNKTFNKENNYGTANI